MKVTNIASVEIDFDDKELIALQNSIITLKNLAEQFPATDIVSTTTGEVINYEEIQRAIGILDGLTESSLWTCLTKDTEWIPVEEESEYDKLFAMLAENGIPHTEIVDGSERMICYPNDKNPICTICPCEEDNVVEVRWVQKVEDTHEQGLGLAMTAKEIFHIITSLENATYLE